MSLSSYPLLRSTHFYCHHIPPISKEDVKNSKIGHARSWITVNISVKQAAHQFVGQPKRRTTKIRLKAVGCGLFGSLFELR